jgi:ribonuclease HI
MPSYVVLKGRKPGIYSTWDKCKKNVFGWKGAKYKKFENSKEAEQFFEDNLDTGKQTSLTDFFVLSSPEIDYYVYTDGSCINNGKPNAKAGIGIYFGDKDPRNVSQRIYGKQTNNVAELTAVIELYGIIEKDIEDEKKIGICTDSKYVINCVKGYGDRMESKNWLDYIPNKELVKKIYYLYKNRKNVYFIHVMAHTGKQDKHSIGNHFADFLANQSIKY